MNEGRFTPSPQSLKRMQELSERYGIDFDLKSAKRDILDAILNEHRLLLQLVEGGTVSFGSFAPVSGSRMAPSAITIENGFSSHPEASQLPVNTQSSHDNLTGMAARAATEPDAVSTVETNGKYIY